MAYNQLLNEHLPPTINKKSNNYAQLKENSKEIKDFKEYIKNKVIYKHLSEYKTKDGKVDRIERSKKEASKVIFDINGHGYTTERDNPGDIVKNLFATKIKNSEEKEYKLEHIEIKSNSLIFTFKNDDSKIKFIATKNGEIINVETENLARESKKKWFSWGGKSRRSKKIAKKHHTRKCRN